VEISIFEPDYVLAMVSGSEMYEVEIKFDEETKSPAFTCTCPYLGQTGPCKHIWATILEVDEEIAEDPELFDLMDEYYDEDEDEFFDEDEDEIWDYGEAYDQYGRGHPIGVSTGRAGKPPLKWKISLRTIRDALIMELSQLPAEFGEIWYLVSALETPVGAETVLEVKSRRPKKRGDGFTKLKPLRIMRREIAALPDPSPLCRTPPTVNCSLCCGAFGPKTLTISLPPTQWTRKNAAVLSTWIRHSKKSFLWNVPVPANSDSSSEDPAPAILFPLSLMTENPGNSLLTLIKTRIRRNTW